MRRVATGVAAALIGLLASANVARAQGAEFSLGGGVAIPLGVIQRRIQDRLARLGGVSFYPPHRRSAFRLMALTISSTTISAGSERNFS